MKQPSFSDLEYANKKKTTRREHFEQLDRLVHNAYKINLRGESM